MSESAFRALPRPMISYLRARVDNICCYERRQHAFKMFWFAMPRDDIRCCLYHMIVTGLRAASAEYRRHARR